MANEKRLIVYDAVYQYAFDGVHGGGLEDEDFDEIINAIDAVPTIDAVEVVRCKDCKHLVLTEEGEHNPNDCVCDYWDTDGLTDDDFCSRGERRTNEPEEPV